MFGRAKRLVGLDIGSSAVKAVELRQSGGGLRVAAFDARSLPRDSILDGTIVDGGAVSDAIRLTLDEGGFTTKDVCASVARRAVFIKRIAVPAATTHAELDASIVWEAERHIPFDIQDVNLDYHVLGQRAASESRGTVEVLLVAAKKERVGDYLAVIADAGGTPVIVDVDAFALQNAFETNYGVDSRELIVVMNAGASAVSINVLRGDESLFTRDIATGGRAYIEAVERELGLSFEAAERVTQGLPEAGAAFDDVRSTLRRVTQDVLLEVQKTLEFFQATASSDPIERIVVSGGVSRVDGFVEMLRERFGVPVEGLDPFRAIDWDARTLGIDAREVARTAGVAVGLALRSFEDR